MRKRNIAAVVILHIITFGVYYFYWTYATRKELIAQHGDPKSIPAFKWLLLPFLALLPVLFFMFVIPEDATEDASALLVAWFLYIFVVVIASIAVFYWWFYHYCKVASAVTKGIEFAPSYILLILASIAGIPVVWQALMQHDINQLANRLAAKNTSDPEPVKG